MVEIQSKEVIDKIGDDLKIQPALKVPRTVSEKIQLTYDCNPTPQVKVLSGTASDDADADIATTHATKRTFVTYVNLSVTKDASSPSTVSSILMTPRNHAEKGVITLRYEPLTAGSHHQAVSFNPPMELKPGSPITLTNSSATASIDLSANVGFYELDPL